MKRTSNTEREESEVDSRAKGSRVSNSETRVEETFTRAVRERRGNKTKVVALIAIVAVAALALLLWWLLGSRRDGAGRPVPAPRTVSTEQTGAGVPAAVTTTEPTLTISPEVAARAGVKIEQVGEQLGAGPDATVGGPQATGVVQANTYHSTPVVSLVGGIVRGVNAELGQAVSRGQTVAVVFSDELAMAQSKYLTALADLEEHEKHHRRTTDLVEIGAASREELEQAVTMMKKAEAEVASERQRLLLLGVTPQRVGALRTSSQINSEVSLPAPISGTVISRAANPGEVIEANKEVLRVADLSSVWVIGQVYEKDLANIRLGSGASVTSNAYPGKVFRGRISYVDPQLDPATRTAQVRVELANPGQMLRIGMYVNLAFATLGGSERTSPTIPAAAVQQIGSQQVVFVATDDPSVFAMRPVRVGAESNGRLTVLEGLTVGERIVTDGSFMLRAEWLKLHPSGTEGAGGHQH
jgi:cobalt-zinc-cadmium efflux system membrane fusion protein